MATVPLSGTDIRLISNVPFTNDYKHTRWFDTQLEQETYFKNKSVIHRMTESNFQRIEGQSYIRVNKSIDQLWSTNYLMFQNAQYNPKWFYAFVTKLEYVNAGLTHVHFQIDVFQTWKFVMDFKPSFVVREHGEEFVNGMPVINTVDEGLNYGTDYDTVSVTRYRPSYGYKWLVIVSKKPFHVDSSDDNVATVVGTPQPLSYYIVPFKTNNDVANVRIGSSIIEMSSPITLLRELRKDAEAVNNIVSIYITDFTGIDFTFYPASDGQKDYFRFSISDLFEGAMVGETAQMIFVKSVHGFNHIEQQIGETKYSGINASRESKLYMYPYTLTIIDDFKGNRIEVKNEYILGDELVIQTKGSLGTSNKVSYSIKNYNHLDTTASLQQQVALSNENALIDSSPNDLPIINDMLAAFIQGNRNTMQTQLNSTVFNGITGALSNSVGTLGAGMSGNAPAVVGGLSNTVQGAGNSVLAIQQIESKIADIKNIPPSMSKMGGNTAYEFGNGYDGIYVIKKQIKPEYRRKLTDFFRMFGYKKNEVKIPNFHTRKHWNYLQTESCYITGNINNEDIQELKSVFDNGITFWHTEDVGNYGLTNEVL